jgi:hypothetical protein
MHKSLLTVDLPWTLFFTVDPTEASANWVSFFSWCQGHTPSMWCKSVLQVCNHARYRSICLASICLCYMDFRVGIKHGNWKGKELIASISIFFTALIWVTTYKFQSMMQVWYDYCFVGLKDTSALLSCSTEPPAAPVQQNSSRQIPAAIQLSAQFFTKFPALVHFRFP